MTAGGSHSLAPDPSAFVAFCLPTIAMGQKSPKAAPNPQEDEE